VTVIEKVGTSELLFKRNSLWRYKKECLPDYDIECWKEAFYLLHNNHETLSDTDLNRCPSVYTIMKQEHPDIFQKTLPIPSDNIHE
jgi:hypothetical protein